MGKKGIIAIKTMLSALKANQLDFELNGNSHLDKSYYWMADSSKIDNAINFLNDLEISPPIECEISGTIQSLDRSGKIMLINENKKIYKVRFDKSVLTSIEKLHLNQFINIKVIKNFSSHPSFEKF